MARIKNVPVKVAAAILGKADQAIRCGLHKEYAGYTDKDILRYAKKLCCKLKLDED